MTTLQTADGRLLRASRPAGVGTGMSGSLFPGQFPPMWSDGERYPNGMTDSGVLASFEQIYRTQPVVAGAVDKLTRRLATLPFGAFQEIGGSREPLDPSHGLATLLRRPRPRYSGVHLLAHIAQSLFIHGNGLVAALRGADRDAPPIMLWPLNWAQTSAYGQPGGDVEWWSTVQFGAEERFISATDVLHFAWPGPDGGPIGVSPLEKLGVTIALEDAAQRYQRSNFANGSRFSSAITFEKDMKRDQLDLARASIENLHKGVDRSNKTILLSGGAKIQPLSMSPVEAALVDQRHVNADEIGFVFDLSGPLRGDLSHGTMANVQEMLKSLYRDVIPPWATLIAETFQSQLIDMEPTWMNTVARFDFSDKLRGDPREHADKLKIEVEAGIISRDEARAELGRAPMGGKAAELTANVNNQAPVEAMDNVAENER
jgi:HK97 family phage portal protein